MLILSPYMMERRWFCIFPPFTLFTTTIAKLSKYRFISLEQASSSMPFLLMTYMAQVSTM